MRWKAPEEYDRTNARYIRRRRSRDQSVYRSLAKGAALLIVVTMIVFVVTHYAAWGTLPD
jgi:hypothetical protein